MAMEDFRVDVVVGKGPGATAIPLELPPFTLVGATTRAGLLPGAAARPVRLHRRTWTSTRRRAGAGAAPVGAACSASGSTADGARRDRRPVPGHAADRQPAAAPGPRLRPGARPTACVDRARSPGPRWSVYEVDELGLDRLDRAVLDALCAGSAAGRWACRRWRSRWARSRRRSRRWPSRSWCARGCSARTPRGRVATAAAWRHLGLTPPRRSLATGCPTPGLFDASHRPATASGAPSRCIDGRPRVRHVSRSVSPDSPRLRSWPRRLA